MELGKKLEQIDSVVNHNNTEVIAFEKVNGVVTLKKAGEAHVTNLYKGANKDEARISATDTGGIVTGILKQTGAAVEEDDVVTRGDVRLLLAGLGLLID